MFVCVCDCLLACVSACVSVHVHGRACVRVCVYVHVYQSTGPETRPDWWIHPDRTGGSTTPSRSPSSLYRVTVGKEALSFSP